MFGLLLCPLHPPPQTTTNLKQPVSIQKKETKLFLRHAMEDEQNFYGPN